MSPVSQVAHEVSQGADWLYRQAASLSRGGYGSERNAINDLRSLATEAERFEREVSGCMDSPERSSSEYGQLIASWNRVNWSFASLTSCEGALDEGFRSLVEDMAALRFYFEYSRASWKASQVNTLAVQLANQSDWLYSDVRGLGSRGPRGWPGSDDRVYAQGGPDFAGQGRSGRGGWGGGGWGRPAPYESQAVASVRALRDAADEFRRQVNGRCESGPYETQQDFMRLKGAYQGVRRSFSQLRPASEQAKTGYIRVIETFTLLRLFYETQWNVPAPAPRPYPGPGGGDRDHDHDHGHGGWDHDRVQRLAHEIEDSTRNLLSQTSLWAAILGGGGKAEVRRAVQDLNDKAAAVHDAVERRHQDPYETREDMIELRYSYRWADHKVSESSAPWFLKNQISGLGSRISELERIYGLEAFRGFDSRGGHYRN